MRRFAAHFIWLGRQVYPMHYLELDDSGRFVGIHPLSEEIACTSFFNERRGQQLENFVMEKP